MARPKKLVETEQPEALQQPETESEQQPLRCDYMVKVRPIHGPMHHLFQNMRIDGVTELEMDNWLEVQIAAGKLELV